jgi:hypothetical protein
LRDSSGTSSVQAFVKLRYKDEARATKLIGRIERATRITPSFHFRITDGTLHVMAPGRFLASLLQQPEVVSASPVPDLGSAYMAPIDVRDASASDVDRPIARPRRRAR